MEVATELIVAVAAAVAAHLVCWEEAAAAANLPAYRAVGSVFETVHQHHR